MRSLLRASLPKVWPALPPEMSFSLLSELERCPHRWALSAADYPEVWDGRGYPPKLHVAALSGSVVHAAVRRVLDTLMRTEAIDHDHRMIAAMRSLGGYSELLSSCTDSVLQSAQNNPRAVPLLESARRRLAVQWPEMRSQVQSLLRRIDVKGVFRAAAGGGTKRTASVQS